MSSDLDKATKDLEGLAIEDKLHVFDIHTEHNLKPPRDVVPRLSEEVKAFLNEVGENEKALLKKPALKPAATTNSYPFTDYFVSSSHNTYLLASQILASSSAECYTHVLRRGCRCVEIDVWPSKNGPIVTHGYALTSSVPFVDVCQAIESFLDDTYGPYNPKLRSGLDFPVLVSLECHVDLEGQQEITRIMKETWGERLVTGPIDGIDDDWVTPEDLAGRIVVMVEFYPPAILNRPSAPGDGDGEAKPDRSWSLFGSGDDSSDDDTDESISEAEDIDDDGEDGEKRSGLWPFRGKKKTQEGDEDKDKPKEKPKISDDLASLGYYARSMKPARGWLAKSFDDPRHVVINISESACSQLLSSLKEHKSSKNAARQSQHRHYLEVLNLPSPLESLIHHSSHHLRRIFPRGTRIRSSNLDPSKFWRSGSQVVSLNWQKYDRGMQMNEGLFVGTRGWVLKPEHMRKKRGLDFEDGVRANGQPEKMVRLRGQVAGVSGIPAPNGRAGKSFSTYIRAELFYHREVKPPSDEVDAAASKPTSLEEIHLKWKSKTHKVRHDVEKGADGFWLENWEWEYTQDDLAFVRFLLYEDEFGKDDRISTFCSPVDRLVIGEWILIRLMNTKGKDVGTTALVKFDLDTDL